MKILLVNGSPRMAAANSRIVLDALRRRIGESHEYRMVDVMAEGEAKGEDLDIDFIVLAFPLYIDSLHARLLSWLLSYEALRARSLDAGTTHRAGARRIGLVAVANNGFYEGAQNGSALRIIENFCARSGLDWRGGAGIGTGEMLREMKGAPDGMAIKRPVSLLLDAVAARVSAERVGTDKPRNLYASHAFPWIAFKAMGHLSWRRMARANGVGLRQMKARPLLAAARS